MKTASPRSKTSSPTSIILPAFLQLSKADIQNKFVDLEWQQRHRLLQGQQAAQSADSPWARLTGDAITPRNRYANVEPFARNRVRLRVRPGSNDYINASTIVLGARRYIATQGPKDTGVADFYRMLAAELVNPAVVVMLTQTHEAGREKCFQYFPLGARDPPLRAVSDDAAFRVDVACTALHLHAPARSQLRTLRLRASADERAGRPPVEREIQHLLFAAWPDFLVPEDEDRAALVELVRLSAQLNGTPPTRSAGVGRRLGGGGGAVPSERDNPRIVHCSAGVGRSGTFIALDALLAALDNGELDGLPDDRDPIAETVDALRQQRMMMVQGESQFAFLYDVLRQQFLARAAAAAK